MQRIMDFIWTNIDVIDWAAMGLAAVAVVLFVARRLRRSGRKAAPVAAGTADNARNGDGSEQETAALTDGVLSDLAAAAGYGGPDAEDGILAGAADNAWNGDGAAVLTKEELSDLAAAAESEDFDAEDDIFAGAVDIELEAAAHDEPELSGIVSVPAARRERAPLRMTRKRAVNYIRRREERLNEGMTAIERPEKPYLPASLRVGGKTFALVYEREGKVSFLVRLDFKHAERLKPRHPLIRQARFPRGGKWYIMPVSGDFTDAQMLYRVLLRAQRFTRA
ncbi:hypothetical protein FACS1894211_15390 [Clostridia bacterium]|nr:hypothetical protein FACS1894211_15390 [Clostridia bacterium]